MHSTAGMQSNLIDASKALSMKIKNASIAEIQMTMEACQNILQLHIQIYKCTINKYDVKYFLRCIMDITFASPPYISKACMFCCFFFLSFQWQGMLEAFGQ